MPSPEIGAMRSGLGLAFQSKGPVPPLPSSAQLGHPADGSAPGSMIPKRASPAGTCSPPPVHLAKEAPRQPCPIPISLVPGTDHSQELPDWFVYMSSLSPQECRLHDLFCSETYSQDRGPRCSVHTATGLSVDKAGLFWTISHCTCLAYRESGSLPLSRRALGREP